ncbi:arabinogalactan protein 14-like [Lycium ferocissimum]|uniref:arabinogalactan protein 14-like n=1 Tax=Lycium ferocissimum TaxID=112874 RepID=UPI0028149E4F|nr:arabinogalactan protein 14-like [Lycium ferocissimum]
MEAMKMNVFLVVVMVVLVAMSGIQNVVAMDAPAPAPASDANVFVPTIVASFVALAFGFFF